MKDTVLIAEPDKDTAQLLAKLVRDLPADVVLVDSIEDGCTAARLNRPCLAIVDAALPDGPGLQLCDYIREVNHPAVMVLVCNQTNFDLVVTAIRSGISDFVERPIALDRVAATIQSAWAARPSGPVATVEVRPRRVLVLDDEKVAHATMEKLLREIEVTCLSAENIGQAREILQNDRVDVVFIDYFLKGENGIDFLSETRDQFPTLPAIVITGSTDPAVAIRSLRAGAFDVLIKGGPTEAVQTAVLRAFRYRHERETRVRLQRELDAFKAGLAHLKYTVGLGSASPPPPRSANVLELRSGMSTGSDDDTIVAPRQLSSRVLEHLPLAILVVDRNLKITDSNSGVHELLQIDRMQYLWRPLGQVPSLAPLCATVSEVINTGDRVGGTVVTLPLGKNTKECVCTAIPDGDDSGVQQVIVCLQPR